MARSRGGYSGYHGRRTLNDTLKVIAVVLAVLVGLLLAGLFFGRKYIVHTDSGLRLDLPFLRQEEADRPDPGDASVAIQPEGSKSEEPMEPQPQPEPETPAMLAVELPVEAVLDGTAGQKLEEAGGNALVLEMKDQKGKLAWVSQQPVAVSAGVNSTAAGVQEALTQWNQGDVYTVARVHCFRDDTVPYDRNDMALRATYGNWRDELGLRRMDPTVSQVQSYLAGLCGELAQLGFDEILLEDCAFPTKGNLEAIAWRDQADPVQTMDAFLAQVEEAIVPYGTKLSIQTERAVLTGAEAGSGLTAASLNQYAQRLWMPQDGAEPALSEVLTTAGITNPDERLVELESSLNRENQRNQAVLNQA